MALAQYSELFWFPSGELAANVTARVFLHEANTLATLYADAGGTVPLANPAATSGAGRLEFWVEEGRYWIHIDSESFDVAVGASTESATLADITAAVSAHSADTTDVHGIPDTAALVATDDTRLTNSRTPTAHAATHADGGTDEITPSSIGALATAGDQSMTGELTFVDRIPVAPGADPTSDNQLTRKAYVDAAVADAGGGSSIVSTDGRIDSQIIVLPVVAGWAIVTTSGGAEIGTSIPASVGDRLWFSLSFLRTYGVVLDTGIKAAAGGVSRYTSSGTSAPEADGYAPMYPQSAFAGVAGMRQFVVQPGEVDGSGNAKIVLAYRGDSVDGVAQKVYFGGGPGYSGAVFVANMGPAPS